MSRILEKYDRSDFDITPNFLEVTFMFSEQVNELANDSIYGSNDSISGDINNKEILKLKLIKGNSKITRKVISEELSISIRTVDRNIEALKNNGIIERVGSNKTGIW